MKTLLISQGGCGTNWLKYRYGASKMCAGMSDINPHQRLPYCPPDTRILYLQAYPIDQLLSFERRGFFTHNMAVRNLNGNEIAFRMIHPDQKGGGNLGRYADLGINCFRWAHHRKQWQSYAIENQIPIKFVCHEMLRDPDELKRLDWWIMDGRTRPENHHSKFSERTSTAENQGISEEQIEMLKQTHKEDIQDWEFLMRNVHALR